MNNKLPFDDTFKRKIKELESLNEDEAWRKMQLLLDEKKTRRPIIFFINYKVCIGVVMLLLSSLCIYNFYGKNKSEKLLINIQSPNKQTIENIRKNSSLKKDDEQKKAASGKLNEKIIVADQSKNNSSANAETQQQQAKDKQQAKSIPSSSQNNDMKILSEANSKKKNDIQKSGRNNFMNKTSFRKNSLDKNKKNEVEPNVSNKSKSKQSFTINSEANTSQKNSSNTNIFLKDSTAYKQQIAENSYRLQDGLFNKQNIDSASLSTNNSVKNSIKDSIKNIVKDSSLLTNKKKDLSLKKKNYFFDIGLQLKQQIPLSGEKLASYNYNGNKNILSDYIPGIFIRFERNKKWFLQGEFTYAAPNLIKPFSFSREIKINYSSSTVSVNSTTLQKTYFTEMPLCFNYYIHSKWFVGAGLEYAWFRGAVTSHEFIFNDFQSGQQLTQNEIMPVKNYTDSFLYKSNTCMLLQAGYSMSKWSFNLRYTKDFKPFITYTEPNGNIVDKKNSSLQFVVDYRLFRVSKVHSKKQKQSK